MDDAPSRAQATYDAAADVFDDPALGFWDRFGRATVDRLALKPGDSVLDACAGSGASAIPAAVRVGPRGKVVAVDLADNLLALARTKAARLGLNHIECRRGDVQELNYSPGAFDAVIIVFGVFFLPDPVRATADLWRLTRSGGQMAVTTWGPRLFEPANSMFWDAVDNVRPDLTRAYNPWDSLIEPDAVRALLTRAGVPACTVEAVEGRHELRSAEDFWTIVRGSRYRATHDALDEAGRDEVRAATLAAITRQHITSIETNVIFAVATKTDDRASTK